MACRPRLSTNLSTVFVPPQLATITALLGARLHFWYEVGVSTETLNAGAYSQLNDYGPGGYHAAQAVVANQPAKLVGGGPNGKSCIRFTNTNSIGGSGTRLVNTTINLASGKALTFVWCACPNTLGTTLSVICQVRTLAGDLLGTSVITPGTSDATHHRNAATVAGAGAAEIIIVTSPALIENWHVGVQRYAAGVVPTNTINGVAVAPAYTVAGLASTVQCVVLGQNALSSGSLYALMCVEDCSSGELQLILSYLYGQTGILAY